ncbi:MAG TPA: hypothetical protein VGM03_05840 [Phycisphaerae bacterium]|jgi:hypothetical protein
MPVTVLCPNLNCRAVLRVPDRTRGKKVRCGQCGMTLLVPPNGPEQAPAGGPPPPAGQKT